MSTVIAYQSLNSNVSSDHNLEASTSQMHTRKAQRTLARKKTERISLNFPTIDDPKPDLAVHGPAQLVKTAPAEFMDVEKSKGRKRKRGEMEEEDKALKEAADKMLGMFQGKARQIYQHAHREFGQACNLLVFGELNASHKNWLSTRPATGEMIHASVFPKACNCFSLHSANSASTTQFIAEGDGWVAANCNGVRVVFVHVPNSLATDAGKATKFYKEIKNKVVNSTASGGGVVDLVMGDTNQASALFSPKIISAGMDGKFSDASAAETSISPVDTYGVTFKGTNSVDTKKFDVAIYNTATVKKIDVRYFSQFSHHGSLAAAYTDHMGILVKVDKK